MENSPYNLSYWMNFLKAVNKTEKAELIIPYGKKVIGKRKWMIYTTKLQNIMIYGTSGAGKTIFLKTLLRLNTEIKTPDQLKLMLVDPRGINFNSYKDSDFLHKPVVRNYDDFKNELTALSKLVEERKAVLKKHPSKKFIPIVTIIEDYQDLMYQNEKLDTLLINILKKGKRVGVSIILSSQYVGEELLDKKTIQLFDNKICMVTYDREIMRQLVGRYRLLNGEGDMIVNYSDKNNLPADIKSRKVRLKGLYYK